MKTLRLFFILLMCPCFLSLKAQVLKVPTLESKGLNGSVKTIEWHSYQAVQDKGMVYVKKDLLLLLLKGTQ